MGSSKKKMHKSVPRQSKFTHLNPGSDEAIAKNCSCPVLDNGHGHGYMGQEGIFVMTVDCPLHGHMCQNIIEGEENEEPTDEHWGDHSE